MRFKKLRDIIIGVVGFALSVFYLIYAMQIKTRPKLTPSYASARIMPTLLGVLLAILSLVLIAQGVKKKKLYDGGEVEKTDHADNIAVILTFSVIIGYIIVMPMLGFILSTAIYLFLQMLILAPPDKRNVPLFAIVAVGFTAIVFVAFRVGLQQLLPRGIIESLIGF